MKELLIRLFNQGKLKIVFPSENVSESYLEKSKSNFESSQILFKENKLEESITLVYYSMYNLVLALLYKVGIKSENHSASIFLLKEIFEFDNSKILEAKSERIDKQYYVGFKVTKKEVEESLKSTQDFNRELRAFVLNIGNKEIMNYKNKFKELIK